MASFRRVGAARWDAPIQVGGPYAAAGVGGIAVNDAGLGILPENVGDALEDARFEQIVAV